MKISKIRDTWRELIWEPCPVCGSRDLEGDYWHIVAKVVCQECGYKESKWRMHTGIGWGNTEEITKAKDSTNLENSTSDSAEDDGIWKPCPNCGSTNVRKDRWKLSTYADIVCQDCGHREDARAMNTRTEGIEKPNLGEANSDIGSKESELELTPKQQLWQNIGNVLVVFGILISLTVVGAVIGIPMIIAGMLISSKGGPDMDEIDFSCPECGAELEHETTICSECGEDGLRLSKSRSLKKE